MKIRTLGFQLTLNGSKSFEDLLLHIAQTSGNIYNKNYIYALTDCKYRNDNSDYIWAGVLLKPKDMNAFPKIHGTNADFHTEIQKLGYDERLIEFNHFIINQNNGKGLYQIYEGSAQIGTLFSLVKRLYSEIENYHNLNTTNPNNDGLSSIQKANKKNKWVNTLVNGKIYLRSDSPEDFLEQLSILKNIELEIFSDYIVESQQDYGGILQSVKTEKRKLTLETEGQNIIELSKLALELIKKSFVKNVKMNGVDADNYSRFFDLEHNNDKMVFWERDYNQIVQLIKYASDTLIQDLQKSVAIDELVRVAKSKEGQKFISK
ncbi:MAG: hypothetical protein U0Y96_12475 [Candidatus Kapaibacterium sp.]|nr:hypothetical protein [Bacteroidota bacterium]